MWRNLKQNYEFTFQIFVYKKYLYIFAGPTNFRLSTKPSRQSPLPGIKQTKRIMNGYEYSCIQHGTMISVLAITYSKELTVIDKI